MNPAPSLLQQLKNTAGLQILVTGRQRARAGPSTTALLQPRHDQYHGGAVGGVGARSNQHATACGDT